MAAILNSGTNGNWEKGICGICPAGCWVEVQKEGERIIDIRPDESHALGMICRRGQYSPEIIYSEHRLKYPMKRVGAKGTFEFERISWDEAVRVDSFSAPGPSLTLGVCLQLYLGINISPIPRAKCK